MKFTIPKNWHYSLPFFIQPHFNVEQSIHSVKFEKNCWYEKSEVEDTGINKLMGYGFGFDHHKNSIRIGWQPDFEKKDSILLYAYWYDETQEGYQKKFIRDVQVNQQYDISITINEPCSDELGACYKLSVMNKNGGPDYFTEVPKNHDIKWGFVLRPYFGGNSRAPWKMKIYIKKIKYRRWKNRK